MELKNIKSQVQYHWIILGFFIFLGFFSLGYFLSNSITLFNQSKRTIHVKGLSEREYPADLVIWNIQIRQLSNNIPQLYSDSAVNTQKIIDFFVENKVPSSEITESILEIFDTVDQMARGERRGIRATYNDKLKTPFRFFSNKNLTIYSKDVPKIRSLMSKMGPYMQKITQNNPQNNANYSFNNVNYLFNSINKIKPDMLDEAILNAQKSAFKFAQKSNSKLGKIKTANQGRFQINWRDSNNPHIKKIRVVSTIEYYLND